MWEPIVTSLIVLVLIILLIREQFSPAFLMFGACILVMLLGIVDGKKALSGFSNPAMLTVAALFVVAAGLERTNALYFLANHLFGASTKVRGALGRLLALSGISSVFFNNTTIVSVFTPAVLGWAKRKQFAVSHLLLPISFMAILGGTCSLIGTSTNLLVHGLMQEHQLEGMGLFELAWVGVPVMLIGYVYLLFASPRLLPDRQGITSEILNSEKNYICDVILMEDCPLIGKSIEAAGLRHLDGLFLTNIERNQQLIGPVSPRDQLEAGDRLIFAGNVNTITQIHQIPGVKPAYHEYLHFSYQHSKLKLYEVVLSYSSPLVGKNLREVRFRTHYNAAVLAVHRADTELRMKLGDIIFRPGDVLLIESEESFFEEWKHAKDFFLVAKADGLPETTSTYTTRAILIVLLMLIAMTFTPIPILHSAFMAAIAMVLSGCLSLSEAKESVFKEFNILVLISSAFGVGYAIEESGLAIIIANSIVSQIGTLHPSLTLMIILMLTALFTEFVTNNAAAAIMFPVGFACATTLAVDPRPFAMGIALASSLCFITPFGYQTNLIVYGPGNYQFRDYVRLGVPLKLIALLVCLVMIPIFWPF